MLYYISSSSSLHPADCSPLVNIGRADFLKMKLKYKKEKRQEGMRGEKMMEREGRGGEGKEGRGRGGRDKSLLQVPWVSDFTNLGVF